MKDYLRKFFSALSDDSIDVRSSSIAYSFMLSIFPLLIGIFATLQLLQQSSDIITWTLNTFDEFFPPEIHEFIMEYFKNISIQRTGSILIFSLAASIGFGSYGFKTIFIHLSRILRDEKPRSFIWITLLSIIFAAGAIVVTSTSFILIMLSNEWIQYVSGKLDLGNVVPLLLNWLRYPFVFAFLIVTTSIVYRMGPKKKMPWKCIFLSASLFTGGWIAATYLFGVYLGEFARYNLIYGTLAGVIIFLVWVYISAFIFLSAAEIGRIRMEHLEREQKGPSDSGGPPEDPA